MTRKITIYGIAALVICTLLWLILKSDHQISTSTQHQLVENKVVSKKVANIQLSSVLPTSTTAKQGQKENSKPTDAEWHAAGIDPSKVEKPLPKGKRIMWSIAQALYSYHSEFGSYPPGNSLKSIADGLFGKNTKQMIFLDSPENHGLANAQGELVDPWETPYQFIFMDDKFEIRSAGPDRNFGNRDDEMYPEPEDNTYSP